MPTREQLFLTPEGQWFKMQCAAFKKAIDNPELMQKAFFDNKDQELPEEYRLKIANEQITHSFYWNAEFLRNAYPCKVTLPQEMLVNTNKEHLPPIIALPSMEFNSVSAAFIAWQLIDFKKREEIQKAEKHKTLNNRIKYIKELPPSYGYNRTGIYAERKAVMTELIRQKYSENNPELVEKLLKTEDKLLLIDGDLRLDDWQYGFDIHGKHGQNLTGRITMDIRASILKGKVLEVS